MPYKDYEKKKQREKERYWENKEYRNEYSRQYSKDNREKINKNSRERKAKNKAYLIEMLGGKCVGCGVTENLQFDHIDRKQKTFTISVSKYSFLFETIFIFSFNPFGYDYG